MRSCSVGVVTFHKLLQQRTIRPDSNAYGKQEHTLPPTTHQLWANNSNFLNFLDRNPNANVLITLIITLIIRVRFLNVITTDLGPTKIQAQQPMNYKLRAPGQQRALATSRTRATRMHFVTRVRNTFF